MRSGRWLPGVQSESMMSKPPRPESRPEQSARAIVAAHLGAAVDRYDDGSQPRMPDGVIRFPDGRLGALEVIGDHGAGFERRWDALEKQGRHLDSPGLQWTWHVSLDHAVNIKQIRRT